MQNNRFKTYSKSLCLAGGVLVLMAPAHTHAGFEWVPAPKQEEAEVITPAPEEMIEPVMDMPMPVTPEPMIKTESAAVPEASMMPPSEAPQQPAQMLKTMDLMAKPEVTSSEPVKLVEPAPQEPVDIVMPAPVPESLVPIAPPQGQIQQFEIQERITTTPKVIMPADAPASALASTANSKKIEYSAPAALLPPAALSPETVSDVVAPEVKIMPAPVPNPMQPEEALSAQEQINPVQKFQVQPLPMHSDKSLAVGFGTDMPLAIALSQIVPAQYAYSFEPGVNPGAKVSWNGGMPWTDVVQNILTPLKLTAVIRGNTVHVMGTPDKMGALEIIDPVEDQPLEAMPIEVSALIEDVAVEGVAEDIDTQDVSIELTNQSRSQIQDPGEYETAQEPEAVERMEELVSQDKQTKAVTQAAATEMSQKKKLKILPRPLKNADNAEPSLQSYSYERAPPPPLDSPVIEPQTNDLHRAEMLLETPPDKKAETPSFQEPEPLVATTNPSFKIAKTGPATGYGAETEYEKQELGSVIAPPQISEQRKEELLAGGEPISISKIRFWEAKQGTSLKETLTTWSAKANTTLIWNASEDYIIKSNILVNDTFQSAIQKVFQKVLEDPQGPYLELISEAGTASPSKLVISDRRS